MNYLLDTHVLLWSLLQPGRLNHQATAALEAPDSRLWLSPISLWEVLVLAEKGRIKLRPEPQRWVRTMLGTVPLQEAPLNAEVAISSRSLDLPHQDPADRFICATAQIYHLSLITADQRLLDAGVVQTLDAG